MPQTLMLLQRVNEEFLKELFPNLTEVKKEELQYFKLIEE
jgi:hypothetical protein